MQAWLASLEGEVGFTPFFVVTDTHIQVGYQRGTEVIAPVDLVNLDDLRPEAGSARWDTILNKPDKFPPEDHKHPASDIEGLVGDISKAEAEEMDEEILRLAKEHADALTVDWDSLSGKPLSFIPAAHTHTISGVDGLDIALSNKTDVGHGHSASEISGLPDPGTSKTYVDEELAKKANISHTHQASDISGLPTPDVNKAYVDSELDKKANTSHQHTFDSITQKPTSYPPSTHTHPASDITGLPTASSQSTDIQIFEPASTANPGTQTQYTWTKPENAKWVQIMAIGAGGSGGGGRQGADGTVRTGGGGGAAGQASEMWTPASMLPSQLLIVVGQGALGGAAATTPDKNGGSGNNGGQSLVRLPDNSITIVTGYQGTGGQPGSTAVANGGNVTNYSNLAHAGPSGGGSPAGGGAGGSTPVQDTSRWPQSGAGGGGIPVTNTANGGGGGNRNVSGGGSWPNATPPGQSAAPAVNGLPFSYAAGGGGSSVTGPGGNGGNGGKYGGGGGGGGASTNGFPSGRGGDGGPGAVIITCWF